MAPLEVALPPPNANAVAGLPPPAKQEAAPDRTQELQLQPAALTKATPPTLDPTMLAPVADKDYRKQFFCLLPFRLAAACLPAACLLVACLLPACCLLAACLLACRCLLPA